MKAPTIFSIFVLLLFLSACNSTAPTPTAPAPTVEATKTVAPSPTEAPTAVTEVPTAVPVPQEGNQIKENGYIYTYQIIKSADGTKEYAGYFRTLTPGEVFLWQGSQVVQDGQGGWKAAKGVGPIQVLVERGVSGADTIRSLTYNQNAERVANNQYVGTLGPLMRTRFGVADTSLGQKGWLQFLTDLQDGKRTITFTISGKDSQWSPSPTVGSVEYIINWDNAQGKDFVEWMDNTNTNHFRTAFWGVNSNGDTIGAFSSKASLKDLSDKQLRAATLFFPISILDSKDMTTRGYSSVLNDYADKSGQDNPPIISVNKVSP